MIENPCTRQFELGGNLYMFNLDHPWVRTVLSIRGLPGQFGDTPGACLRRFETGLFSTDDVERVIELGLIGGGMTRGEASEVIDKHVRRSPVTPNAVIAAEILAALFIGASRDNASA